MVVWHRMSRAASVLLLVGLTTACVHQPPPLYGWGRYQAQVYEHFKATRTNPEDQILVLEQDLEEMRAAHLTPAPGFHAHLGMLYTLVGRDDKAMTAFQAEKALFPESAKYIDFLVTKAKPPAK